MSPKNLNRKKKAPSQDISQTLVTGFFKRNTIFTCLLNFTYQVPGSSRRSNQYWHIVLERWNLQKVWICTAMANWRCKQRQKKAANVLKISANYPWINLQSIYYSSQLVVLITKFLAIHMFAKKCFIELVKTFIFCKIPRQPTCTFKNLNGTTYFD